MMLMFKYIESGIQFYNEQNPKALTLLFVME